jgi:hypothetical protein
VPRTKKGGKGAGAGDVTMDGEEEVNVDDLIGAGGEEEEEEETALPLSSSGKSRRTQLPEEDEDEEENPGEEPEEIVPDSITPQRFVSSFPFVLPTPPPS